MAAAENGRNLYRVVGVGFGLLCILQAALNISLRLALYSSHSTTSDIEASYKNLTEERDMLKRKLSDSDNKTLDMEASFKTLTEERDELKKTLEKIYLGWVYFSGSVYYISSNQKSWDESRADCLKKGADLMIINSKEEQNFTRRLKDNMWIGLTDRETESIWKWVDGTPLKIRYWIPGEPNNFNKEHCVEVRFHEKENNWNDKPCNYQNFWICEKKVAL